MIVRFLAIGCLGACTMASLTACAGSIHDVEIVVIDCETGAPIEGAWVEVERQTVRFLSLRARPSFPGVQRALAGEDGRILVRMVDGDQFLVYASAPPYDRWCERVYVPWQAAGRRGLIRETMYLSATQPDRQGGN